MRDTDLYKNNSIKLLEDNNLLIAPIDLNKLAEKLNIDVNYELLDEDISGKINYNFADDKVIININSNEYELRQRFSLAHELAHYIYDIDFTHNTEISDNEQTLFRKGVINPIEKRANKFAEKLLMPKDLLIENLYRIKDDLFPNTDNSIGIKNIYKIVEEISDLFKVSKPAVIVRLHSVGKIKSTVKRKLFAYHYD